LAIAAARFVFEEMAKRLKRHVVHPLASLLGSEQLSPGDVILIDCDHSQLELKFTKQAEDALDLAGIGIRECDSIKMITENLSCFFPHFLR